MKYKYIIIYYIYYVYSFPQQYHWFYARDEWRVQHMYVNKLCNELKSKNHVIISIDAEKIFYKNQAYLHDKSHRMSRNRGNIL